MTEQEKKQVKPAGVLAAVVQSGQNIDIYKKINTICLILIAGVSITLALIYTKTILIPLVVSIFIYVMITPIISFLRRRFKFPKWLAVFVASVAVTVPLVLMVIFVVDSVAGFIRGVGVYQARVAGMFNQFLEFCAKYNLPLTAEMFQFDNVNSILVSSYSTKLIKSLGTGVLSVFSYMILSLIFLFFLLIGSGSANMNNSTAREIQNKVSAYLYIHIVMSLLTGLLVWAVYAGTGLELALMFGVLTFILNFIPNVGSFIAVVLPLPIAFIQFGMSAELIVILAVPSAIQFAIGSLLEPKLLGEGMDLHPVTIVGSLIFWALVWGVPGAFLAVPITAAVRIILNKMEPTRPFAEILSGRLPQE